MQFLGMHLYDALPCISRETTRGERDVYNGERERERERDYKHMEGIR